MPQPNQNQIQHEDWNRGARWPNSDQWRDGYRDKGGVGSSEGMKSRNFGDIKCFRCLGLGHHQSECTREPVCYKCKLKGHMVVDCKTFGAKKLQMYGFGIPG
jgi:hypothetical protein